MTELDVEKLKEIATHLSNPAVDSNLWAALDEELVEQLPAIIAALEDRDRLRAAIERAVDADDGSCPWMTELQEIALEGRDG